MLDDILVVEVGARIAAGACGSLLAQAGATVVFVEPAGDAPSQGKWISRPVFAAGKESVAIDTNRHGDVDLLNELLGRADIVLSSSDCDGTLGELVDRSESAAIRCDFPGFGADAGRAGAEVTDQEIQSLSGVAYTTGFPGEAPVPLRMPVIEYSAAVYGAAASVLGLIGADRDLAGRTIEVSLYDCAINSLLTFLPAHFAGSEPGRLGNGHSMAVPWNAYRARNGWILVCSATDPQWQSICEAMQRPELSTDLRFAKLADRVANRETIDLLLADWVGQQEVDACAEQLAAFGVAHGPVLPVSKIARDRNLLHRGMVLALHDPAVGEHRYLPGSPLRFSTGGGRLPSCIPAPDGGRERVARLLSQEDRRRGGMNRPGARIGRRPLEGIRVVEIGQYTTAPLAGRHLASFGAEVIKVEPLTGDAARAWQPLRDGLSLFFAMSNAGKASVALDLKSETGRARFAELLRSADILVENLKPGSLARLGFGADRLATLNPRLIYCAITGFGADSVHGVRPAFDTVIQAMSGMMDVNASDGRPLKAGISICDVMGGEIGLFAILSALRRRERTGTGLSIDLAMHDIAAWMTAPFWPGNSKVERGAEAVVECADGHALVTGEASRTAWPFGSERPRSDLPRRVFAERMEREGLRCTPILSVSEAVADGTTTLRKLIIETSGKGGVSFPLVSSPMRISGMPTGPGEPIGQPKPFDEAVLASGGEPAGIVPG